MTFYPRESWQDPDNPITGPKPKARRTVGVLHYSGSNSIPGDYPSWLRSMQNDYTKNRGYSLGYGHLVVGSGDQYEIRGDDFNMASNNGDKVDGNANDWTLSILLDVTTTSAATPAQIETCKDIFAAAGIYDRPVPHSFYDYTSCCGATVTDQINAGMFDQSWEPDPTPNPIKKDVMEYIAVPTYPGSGPNSEWWACFASGAVRRAVNSDVTFAQLKDIPQIPQDSKEHDDFLRSIAIQ